VNFITLFQQKLSQVRSILACDSRDERLFHSVLAFFPNL
jgi:hypothetical protein